MKTKAKSNAKSKSGSAPRTDPKAAVGRLRKAGVLSPTDAHLAFTLAQLDPTATAPVLLGAAFASRAVAQGHICADLRQINAKPLVDAAGEAIDLQLPALFEWVMELGQSELCSDGSTTAPLVFDGEARLYLTRYWQYQQRLAAGLRARASVELEVDRERLREGVQRLFAAAPDSNATPDPRQMLAAVVASVRRLAVITGGPGTGKTTTVVRVLALLIEAAFARHEAAPRILLLAPTGKAAARLSESITASRDKLDTADAVKDAIPQEASTLHRRLGYQPWKPTQFARNAAAPLAADVVLVDEASMVDLALMAKLVDALAPHTRLILLGDKDQLASVEAGAILGDICNTTASPAYSAPFSALLRDVLPGSTDTLPLEGGPDETGAWDCMVELTRSYRFSAEEGIGRFARAVGSGDAQGAVAQLKSGDARLRLCELRAESEVEAAIRPALLDAFTPYFDATDPEVRLEALARYRLLSAHRRGGFGTERLNLLIEDILARSGRIRRDDRYGAQYDGRPVLITSNDYQLELFNGDVGVVMRDGPGPLRAFLQGRDGTLRSFVTSRLPPHESVFAMTVHKSQGSEFERIGLMLPPALSPILTRELVYTGVTRAKEHVTLYGTTAVLEGAIGLRIDRASGLRDALWGAPVG